MDVGRKGVASKPSSVKNAQFGGRSVLKRQRRTSEVTEMPGNAMQPMIDRGEQIFYRMDGLLRDLLRLSKTPGNEAVDWRMFCIQCAIMQESLNRFLKEVVG